MKNPIAYLLSLALVTAAILAIPLVAMQFNDEVVWTLSDFVLAGTLIFGTGALYLLATRMSANTAYRAGAGLALATTFVLVWVNGAVGIIGDSDVNMLYVAVPMVELAGALIVGFRAIGMARALFAAALVQALVPVIALAIREPDFAPGVLQVFFLNSIFVALFGGAGFLFQRAACEQRQGVEPQRG